MQNLKSQIQNRPGSLVEKVLGQSRAGTFRIASRTSRCRAQQLTAVRTRDHADEVKLTTLESSVGGDGSLTSTTQTTQRSALGANGAVRGRVIQKANGIPYVIIVLANLDRQCPLSYSRTDLVDRKVLPNPVAESQAMDARRGHHQRVAVSLVEFSEPGVEVPSHRDQLEILAQVTQLNLTSQAARSHPRPRL